MVTCLQIYGTISSFWLAIPVRYRSRQRRYCFHIHGSDGRGSCWWPYLTGWRTEESNWCSWLHRMQLKNTAGNWNPICFENKYLILKKARQSWLMLQTWIELWKFNHVPNPKLTRINWSNLQNVKAVFDAAIKVVLQPPKPKRKRRKARKCVFL